MECYLFLRNIWDKHAIFIIKQPKIQRIQRQSKIEWCRVKSHTVCLWSLVTFRSWARAVKLYILNSLKFSDYHCTSWNPSIRDSCLTCWLKHTPFGFEFSFRMFWNTVFDCTGVSVLQAQAALLYFTLSEQTPSCWSIQVLHILLLHFRCLLFVGIQLDWFKESGAVYSQRIPVLRQHAPALSNHFKVWSSTCRGKRMSTCVDQWLIWGGEHVFSDV